MFKELLKGDTLIGPAAKTPVYYQISQFNPLRRDNVDGILDLLTYARRVMEEFAEFIAISAVLGIQEEGNARVRSAEDNCSF